MHIQSINIAQSQTIEHDGKTLTTGIYKKPGPDKIEVTSLGLVGDFISDASVHGGEDQAVYLYSIEDTQWWSKELGRELPPGTFGENFTTAGVDLRELKLGDQLQLANVTLEISAPRTPCFKLALKMEDTFFVKRFANASRPGAYARVLQAGEVAVGESFVWQQTSKDYAKVVDVFDVWHAKDKSRELIEQALASPLACVHRKKLEQWLG